MPKVSLKYMGRKPDLKLRMPRLKGEYDFTPENNMTCEVDTGDARWLQEQNPGMFACVGATGSGPEPSGDDSLMGDFGQDGTGGDDSQPGEGGDDDAPAITSEAVEAAKKAMADGGYKLPGNVSKPGTIMEHYQKFLAQKDEAQA